MQLHFQLRYNSPLTSVAVTLSLSKIFIMAAVILLISIIVMMVVFCFGFYSVTFKHFQKFIYGIIGIVLGCHLCKFNDIFLLYSIYQHRNYLAENKSELSPFVFDQISNIYNNKMLGSLEQFLELPNNKKLKDFHVFDKKYSPMPTKEKNTRRRIKTTLDNYVPSQKTVVFDKYNKNVIFKSNRRKYNSVAQQEYQKQLFRKPLFEHRQLLVKSQITRDYIAKEEIKRKRNLLRAIVKMEKFNHGQRKNVNNNLLIQKLSLQLAEVQPQQVLKHFKSCRTEERGKSQENQLEQSFLPSLQIKKITNLENKKRLEFEQCLNWAKIHHKNGDYFAKQLGKLQQKEQPSISNRQLLSRISKKLQNCNFQ